MAIPDDIRSTLEWLIQIEDFRLARDLALTIARFLPCEHPETSDFLAMVFHRTKYYREALEQAEKTVALLPENIEARYNLARCLHSAGQPAKAEKEIRFVVEARPEWPEPQLDQALYISAQGRFDEAEVILRKLRARIPTEDPNRLAIDFNLAWHQIRHGHLKEGLNALSIGRKIKSFGNLRTPFDPQAQLAKGASVEGKKILVVGEAGAGDEMTQVRFARNIHQRGGRCFWLTHQKLENLFSRVPGIERVLSPSEIQNFQFDYWVPAMDLFSTLDLEAADISPAPYLRPDAQTLLSWQSKIKDTGHLKVGLRWQGNPLYEQDLYRSVPFALFRPHLNIAGVDFYSLQRDSGTEELQSSDPVTDLSRDLLSWEDTAAAISLLDIVITSCTSIAHLAGALGKKTWLFTPLLPYYIWASPGQKSIWYADVTLYRQSKLQDWKAETESVFAELKAQADKRLI
jgi:tetratricopeptide (TPR) repeat protein